MNARIVAVLKRRCIACLADGAGTRLWLIRAGEFFVAFCPQCDGTADDLTRLTAGATVMSAGDLPGNDTSASALGGA